MTSFLDYFKGLVESPVEHKTLHHLHSKVILLFPQKSENEIAILSCVAGLLARVAFVDLDFDHSELEKMATILAQWGQIDSKESYELANLAYEEVKELGGLENHLYCHPLGTLLDIDKRRSLLGALFAIAASDESVSGLETEEIRLISKGLLLEPGDFIAAKFSVKDYLAALK